MLLKDKVAVIYGAGGAIGGAAARAFAREGAVVYLAGRSSERLETVASDIAAAGGRAEVRPVDALEGGAVDAHVAAIVAEAGRLDISYNVIELGDTQGRPIAEMPQHIFELPIVTAMRTHFYTAGAAARHMQGSGVILALTANAGTMAIPNAGGFGVACAAIEAFCRQLAAEVGPKGIRVVCLRSAGSPDAPGVAAAFSLHAQNAGISVEQFEARDAANVPLRHLPRLREVANAAVLAASDHASAMTAAVFNVTCGQIAD
jgi:NAD(P)-dependent dehydrogenase (short-subunit alcohol dehydrogenase family)